MSIITMCGHQVDLILQTEKIKYEFMRQLAMPEPAVPSYLFEVSID